jgi:hypothetical protein
VKDMATGTSGYRHRFMPRLIAELRTATDGIGGVDAFTRHVR